MPRLVKVAAAAGLWGSLAAPVFACPWLWPEPYAIVAYPPPCPPPIVRGVAPCPCPRPAAACPAPSLPRPTTPPVPTPPPPAVPTPAPPSASIEPPLADPPAAPPPASSPPPPPLAPPNPVPTGAVAQVNAAQYPAAEEDDDPHFFDTYIRTAGPGERRPNGRCVVSFQNLTGREVTLIADTQRRVLAPEETWRVEPPRQFVWRMEGRPAQSEAVSTNLVGLEIVLRR
jgi:hypothetical protein